MTLSLYWNLLKISNDALLASDSGKLSFLLSFDFPSAFDTVDHSLLLQHLNFFFGISGCSFFWLNSYLSNLPPLFLLTTLFFFSSLCSFWCTSGICSRASSFYSLHLSSPLSHRTFLFSKSAFCWQNLYLLFFSYLFPFFYSWKA